MHNIIVLCEHIIPPHCCIGTGKHQSVRDLEAKIAVHIGVQNLHLAVSEISSTEVWTVFHTVFLYLLLSLLVMAEK